MKPAPLVLHLCPTAGPLGGIWTYIRHITESRLAGPYRFATVFYPGASTGVSLRVLRLLRHAVQAHAPDLVHVHGLQTEGFHCMMGALLGSRAPRLLTVHGFIEDSKFRTPWRRAVIAHALEPLTVRAAQAVFTVSRYGAQKPVIRRWARRALGCIDNALPPGGPSAPAAAAALRRRYGWSAADVVAVCVTRLSREKGLLDLVDAFEQLALRQPHARLLLVGDGPDAGLLQARLARSPAAAAVFLHPPTAEVAPLLGAADLFVLPSLHENQSFAILEAMAAGLPVLSTRVGGTPELVEDGVTGLLVPPSAPRELAAAWETLVLDAGRRIGYGRAGEAALNRRHHFDDFLQRLDEVYRHLLPGVAPAPLLLRDLSAKIIAE